MKISYDSSEMLEDIREDIMEFGMKASAWAVWKKIPYKIPLSDEYGEADIIINYLLDSDDDEPNPPTAKELEGGIAVRSTLGEIYKLLKKQHSIF